MFQDESCRVSLRVLNLLKGFIFNVKRGLKIQFIYHSVASPALRAVILPAGIFLTKIRGGPIVGVRTTQYLLASWGP